MNKPSLKLLALAALPLVLSLPSCQEPKPDQAQRPTTPISFSEDSFRITFGLNDNRPSPWDGRIYPSDGQELVVEPDRFRVHLYKGLGDQRDPNPEFPNDYVRPPTVGYAALATPGCVLMRVHPGSNTPAFFSIYGNLRQALQSR